MTYKQSIGNRITSIILTIAFLFTIIPFGILTATAASVNGNRVADPSTMDAWKTLFPISGNISTENAGGVWMDKSVFADASAFDGLGITQNDPNSFLVALSAIAANMNVTGMSHVPTDTMLVLDVSGSMNDNTNNNDVAEDLVDAANESIAELLATNKYNRVGVVLYSGPTTQGGAASANDAVLVLPLGRYTTNNDNKYLIYNVTSNNDRNDNYTTETVSISQNVRIEGTSAKPTSKTKTVVGGTYIQKGVTLAMDQFIASSNYVTIDDPVMGTLQRKPVLVLMSDGAPTVGSTTFTAPSNINLGDGTYTNAALGFVSQLSAAYAKAKIEEKYGTDALFYTLGLGLGNDSIAISVMDPGNRNGSTAVDDFWNDIQRDRRGRITFEGYNHIDVGETVSLGDNLTVTKVNIPLEQNYVDQYFSAESERLPDGTIITLEDKLKQAFADIVSAIRLQSGYFPTLISDNEDLSGYISFVDKIGQYMNVTDIKGILIDNHLFSGADLASNFVLGGGALGTYDDPTALGIEMVAAVRERLGLDSDDTARTLIGLAYENGQLSYTNANNYSNYIGWYANAAGQFLGFYNKGTTILPAATGDADTDPAFIIRSYGYLGAVDESNGVTESDMMYATVQVRKNIATGEELVTFAIPAALIPIVSYNVTLDEDGNLSNLTVSGADNPIRLVYEVALQEGINSFNLNEIISAEYLADEHNINADGSVNFYTNQWEHQNTTGYGTVNTYSYFNPSRQNDKYYYLEDAPVYTDTNGTLYIGDRQPSGIVYRSYKVYKNNGRLSTETIYRELSDAAKATAVRKNDGTWYIPKGNVHVNLDGYTIDKTENPTETLGQSFVPFVDTHNHSIDEEGYDFYVGATLGNNGKLTVTPETGIKLTKTMAEGATAPTEPFTFNLFNETDPYDSRIYPAWLIEADGTERSVDIYFDDGFADVELNAGDVLYIGGMKADHTFRIVEEETVDYVASATGLSETGTVTTKQNEILPVSFVNDDRGVGSFTVAKVVEHDFGVDYQIPADKVFTMQVTLSGIGTANATFKAEHTNGTYTEITTDANGKFTVALKHDEQFEVFELPAGTTVTVVEQNPSAGFTPAYWDNGQIGDGIVTVLADSTSSVIVINDYVAEEVHPVNINLSGTKYVRSAAGEMVDWADNYRFEIVLERYGINGWENVDTKILSKDQQSFTFDMSKEVYDAPGVYSYQVYEVEPEIGDTDRVDGMIYDLVWHTFTVHVYDVDMDGQLEIVRVHSDHANKDFEPVNGVYNVTVDFNNTQTVTVPAIATIEIQKILNNDSDSTLVSLAGYDFGLYTDADCTVAETTGNGISAISLNPTDSVGEGWIDIQFDTIGTYTFYVKEIAGDINKMSYSEQIIKIVVEVTTHTTANNALVADIAYFTADGDSYNLGTDGEVEFTNTYDPDDTELTIDFVSKELRGRDMAAGEFTFEVQTQDGVKVLDGTNTTAGKVTFNDNLKFDKVGTYVYNIVETSTDGNGVVTDKNVYRIIVTVSDANGRLSASYVLVNATGNTITFKNTYTATPTEHSIVGTKNLRGRTLINDEFTFILTELTVDGNAVQNPKTWTVKNQSANRDNIVFPTIKYDKAGTYTYSVEEMIPEGGSAYGIIYDTTQYKVTVVVKDNGEGALEIDSETVTLLNNTPASALTFLNYYEAKPTSAQFYGEKQLTGKVNNALLGGEYEFELYNSDENWELGSLKETVENGAGGIFTFTEIDFTTDEDQYFIVVEKNGGQTINGTTYDDTVYRVWVEVTDDLKGQLHAKVHIYDGEGIPQDKILFVNIYEITGGATVTLSGEKLIDGRDFNESDSFTFELYEADENFNSADTPAFIADMDKDTHKYQITLDYTAEDAGKTYYYVLKETNAGQTINGITYSEAVYEVMVVVDDNDAGGIKTTVTVENATTSTLNFVNEYNSDKTFMEFEGTKTLNTLSGIRELKENDFTFDLYKTTESFEIDGMAIQSVKNNVDGSFAFEAVEFTEEGTYYFVIKENSLNPIGGVVYDNTQYHITVTVSDNGKGQMEVTETVIMKVNGETTESAEIIAFVNEYNVEVANVTISGNKKLSGRDLSEGEFRFLMYEADETFEILEGLTAKVSLNNEDGSFSFDALSFTEVGTYYFVIYEDSTVEAERVSFDDSVYYVTIDVTDNENGNLVASDPVIVKQGSTDAVETIEFTNVYLPKPVDIIVEIDIHKTVVNKGTDTITPEGFEFLLIPTTDDADGITVKSDANGKAKFALTFTEDDIGKTYSYKLSEVNSGKANVTYSSAEYAIAIAIALDEESNTLIATMMLNEAEATELVAEFENIYDYTPKTPQTGDDSNIALWMIMMFISGGAVITLTSYDRKKRNAVNN